MPDYQKIASDYCLQVLDGTIHANKFVKQCCERQLRDLTKEGSKGFPYIYDPAKGAKVCAFVELLPHIKGKLAGQPIQLEPWQIFIVMVAFSWVHKDTGFRRFRRTYIEIPRGNGKSAISSAIGLYALAGDEEGGAEVYSFATTRDQAKIVFGDAQQMARKTAGLRNHFGLEVNAHNINILKTASKMEALSSEGSTLDGLNTHFAIIDELHAHKTRAVYDVVETSIGKRTQSMLWIITTAGSNRAGICYEVRGFVKKVLDGSAVDETQFGIIYGLDNEPYNDIIQSSSAILRLDKLCNCKSVSITQIEQVVQEVCASLAMTNGAEIMGLKNAQITPKDQLGLKACAEAVMSNTCSTINPIKNKEVLKKEKNGQEQTKIKQSSPMTNGEANPKTEKSSELEILKNMELAQSDTENYANSNNTNAEFARNKRNYVLTIATLQELLEDYSVSNATRQLVYSEILKKVYKLHSNTCKVKQSSKIENNNLVIKVDGDDWTTEEALIKANPNWGVSVMPEVLLPLQAKAMSMPSAANNFRTKHLNEWVNADVSWMDMRAWDACADPTLSVEDFEGSPCYMALDLASKTDIAAKINLYVRDGHYYAFGDYYLPRDTVDKGENSQYSGWESLGLLTVTDGAIIDFMVIENKILEDCKRFEVIEVPYDPFQATQLSMRLLNQGVNMVEVRPTVLNFSEPMKQLEALVLDKKFHHNGDPVLTWMVSNVVCHTDAKDNIYPRKERHENKIDGVVALIMALSRAIADNNEHGNLDDFLANPIRL